jgi:hypothetical protein
LLTKRPDTFAQTTCHLYFSFAVRRRTIHSPLATNRAQPNPSTFRRYREPIRRSSVGAESVLQQQNPQDSEASAILVSPESPLIQPSQPSNQARALKCSKLTENAATSFNRAAQSSAKAETSQLHIASDDSLPWSMLRTGRGSSPKQSSVSQAQGLIVNVALEPAVES